ncbi:MAG TPA: M1 family metallopeptidase [Chitinophagaceae bacterium]|nr:M1 family metallopeptidase [Chitinophagaceae bacterium]
MVIQHRPWLTLLAAVLFTASSCAQPLSSKKRFTSEDTLRGSITPERAWWDVSSYNIHVTPDYKRRTIYGWNQITFRVLTDRKGREMQLDLQEPMKIDSVLFNGKRLPTPRRRGNVYYVNFGNHVFATTSQLRPGEKATLPSIRVYFQGKPREAVMPPWDGGWIWSKDAQGRPWMSVACQGLGASVWYPCKDHQSDEPEGAMLQIRVPDTLVAVGNGRLYAKDPQGDGTTLFTWQVKSPINNYNIIPYIGKYIQWSDHYKGEKGNLTLDYWVLDYNLEKSKKQFGRDVKPMLRCFEHWFGPFPFYEDGFKMVEAPHLGMEHQSAIAYGNHYMNGYLGSDLSETGWGMSWDYIIVHEGGHEWFGNNITTRDIADMWVHEGFTDYSETLFVECMHGKKAADEYTQGLRNKIQNDRPMIGPYGVNQEGSGDMYYKGNNLIHMVRQLIGNDTLFRNILRGMNREFYHRTVTSSDIENYISKKSGKDFKIVFNQYLRTTRIPVLEYRINGNRLTYRWNNCIPGFNMPVRMLPSGQWLRPTEKWQHLNLGGETTRDFAVDPNFYITVRKLR